MNRETVTSVRHWTDRLFSFTTTRDSSLRFQAGQFIMIGLQVEGRPLLRAYSICSSPYADHLEFYSIKVPDGPLTSRLQLIEPGTEIVVGGKPTGTLLLDNLLPGRNLWLLATGTGLAPFGSLLREPETYERFERVVLMHGCRRVEDLAYGREMLDRVMADEYMGSHARDAVSYHPTVTGEAFDTTGRVTELLFDRSWLARAMLSEPTPGDDRVMICGNQDMLQELHDMLSARGFVEGNMGEPGHFVVEKAFAQR